MSKLSNQLIFAILISALVVIVGVGIYCAKNPSILAPEEFRVLDDLTDLNSQNTALKSEINKFYEYRDKNHKFIVFKIREITYTSSIEITNVKLTKARYSDGNVLRVTLKVDVEEGSPDSRRDWPLTAEKYIIMKVDTTVDKLYVNGTEYTEL